MSRRILRWLGWGGAALALSGLVLAAGLYWALGSPAGLRTLAVLAQTASGGMLTIEGVEGRLADRLRIRALRIETATQRIELAGLALDWQPRALWNRQVVVRSVALDSLTLTTLAEDDTPPRLPASLRAPLALFIEALDVGTIRLVALDGGVIELQGLTARLVGQAGRWRVESARVTTPWAALAADVELAQEAPFTLDGRIEATRQDPVPVRLEARLGGTLDAPRLSAEAHAEGLSASLVLEAAPFAAVKLTALRLAGEGVDLRAFKADAPEAVFAFAGVFEGRPGERVLGTLSVVNTRPGRLDRGRLPLEGLTAAVAGEAGSLDFRALSLDFGRAGRFTGEGYWRAGRVSVALASPRIDLAALHGALAPTRLEAAFTLAGDAARQTLEGRLVERWGQGAFTLVHTDGTLALESADFSGGAGRLAARGTLGLAGGRPFALTLDARQIDPARFGRFPRGRLNLAGTLSGRLDPPAVEADLSLPPGQIEGRPVAGHARARWAEARLSAADVDLDLAGNRIRLTGGWGRPADTLRWQIDAPNLARLGFGLAGRIDSQGTLARQRVAGTLDARGLVLPGETSVDSARARAEIALAANGVFSGELDARGLALPGGYRVMQIEARLSGVQEVHTLALGARLPQGALDFAMTGGLGEGDVWRGRLERARLDGTWPVRLTAPATLELARHRQRVSGLVLDALGGQVALIRFEREGSQMASRGRITALPVAPFLALAPALPFSSDLALSGEWDITLADTLGGSLRVARAQGDVTLTEPRLKLGLTTLVLALDARAGEVAGTLEFASQAAGSARIAARAPLLIRQGVPALSRSAPLSWTARADVPGLAAARPLLPVGMRLDAALSANLAGSGSLADPRIEGVLDVRGIRFALPEEGVYIEDGTLGLTLAGDRVRVREGVLTGRNGRILLSGEAELRNPRAGLVLDFQRFAATQRSDRRIDVSGRSEVRFADRRLRLTGALTADRARLDMPEASKPALSSDVVIIGAPERDAAQKAPLPLDLDLALDLGQDFLFKGAGLDARLVGRLRVYTQNAALRGEGQIAVERGRFSAYAQTLDITRGVLRFAGALDNPGLDVLAIRPHPTVQAGVQVRGTVQSPVVTLYSDPPMPDTEKLAWLVLGRGLGEAGQQEFVLMQVAAAALLSQAQSVNFQTALAETLRIDSFDVRTGDGENLGTAIVSVGKRLSSRATLTYEQSLDGLNQAVKVLYQLTPRVRIEAQAGQPSSIDAFFSREYD